MCELKVETTGEEAEYTFCFSNEEFLREYEKYPCLWDKKHVQFRNRMERLQCEEKLCETFGVSDILFLRRKIRSIRGTYNTEIRKIKQCLDSGLEVYPPKLAWFPLADRFLRTTTDLPYEIHPLVEDATISFKSGYKKQSLYSIKSSRVKRQKLNSEGDYTSTETTERNEAKIIPNNDNTEHYDEYEELESSVQGETEELKREMEDESEFDRTEHLEVASTIPEQLNTSSNSSDLSIIVKCLKTLTQSTENEFTAFGQWLALQLQSMPLELALQMQMDIHGHLTKSRMQYVMKQKKKS